METLSVKNFRSILDSGNIKMKPITILLGRNSCGKSSFIRLLPLLKQSLEVDTAEPLLWYGDYVDFGSYSDIRPFNKNEDFELGLTFNLIPGRQYSQYMLHDYFFYKAYNKSNYHIDLKITFTQDYISIIKLQYFNQDIKLELEKDYTVKSIYINGDCSLFNVKNYRWGKSGKELIPRLYEIVENNRKKDDFLAYNYLGVANNQSTVDKAIEQIKKFLNPKTSDSVAYNILASAIMQSHSKEELLTLLQNEKRSKTLKEKFKNKTIEDEDFCLLNNLIVFLMLDNLILNINATLNAEFNNTFYLKPIRANVNRYYRVQGINVNNVDSMGNNLPMILYNLDKDKIHSFSQWCKEQLGLVFKVDLHEGHVSLMVRDLNDKDVNLADTGYGYSQMLPIIVQLWLLKDKTQSDKQTQFQNYSIIIEQPELHLHPAFQAKLMDIFVGLVNEMQQNGHELKIIFETHSETMINELGDLVYNKKISRENVNIVLVEKQNDESKFTQTSFGEDGFIEEWPAGFMSSGD